MRPNARMVCLLTVFLLFSVLIACLAADTPTPVVKERPVIQLAILLDTSNSMDGLIAQAKTQLWNIVNTFVTAKRDGQVPQLQIALYEYGKSSLPAEGGYIRQILPLTTDLDKVSEQLFALTTNGGSEHCGQVIGKAVQDLAWSETPGVLKTIFIAGNEPFTQGPVDYHISVKAAITKGITVNTIHCGSLQEGINTGWKDGAVLADGSYMAIDQNQKVVEIPAPQDQEIAKLNESLNATYVPFGAQGVAGKMNQVAQDTNSAGISASNAASRAAAKASSNYTNATWDLVDAVQTNAVKLEEVKVEDLPEAMQKMTPEERKAYIDKQATERAAIREQIGKLNAARSAFITEELKKQAAPGVQTVESAVVEAVRTQAVKQGYMFEEAKAE
ncbi:MAG: vWA domain-containing protein [Armatimonadota bacterium]